jgi:hypothetical protein
MADVAERVAKLRDEDLILTVTGGEHEGYLPEVIDAAKAELARRRVSGSQIFQTRDAMIDDKVEAIRRNDGSALRMPLYAAALVGGFIPLLIAALLMSDSSKGKIAREAGLFGVLFWVSAVLLYLLIHQFVRA